MISGKNTALKHDFCDDQWKGGVAEAITIYIEFEATPVSSMFDHVRPSSLARSELPGREPQCGAQAVPSGGHGAGFKLFTQVVLTS